MIQAEESFKGGGNFKLINIKCTLKITQEKCFKNYIENKFFKNAFNIVIQTHMPL